MQLCTKRSNEAAAACVETTKKDRPIAGMTPGQKWVNRLTLTLALLTLLLLLLLLHGDAASVLLGLRRRLLRLSPVDEGEEKDAEMGAVLGSA